MVGVILFFASYTPISGTVFIRVFPKISRPPLFLIWIPLLMQGEPFSNLKLFTLCNCIGLAPPMLNKGLVVIREASLAGAEFSGPLKP